MSAIVYEMNEAEETRGEAAVEEKGVDSEDQDEEDVEALVERVLVQEAHKRKLQKEMLGMHRHIQMLGDKMSTQICLIIKQYISKKAGVDPDRVRINWGDRVPMTRDIEDINGILFVSTRLARAVVVEVQRENESKPLFLKLSGGSKKRNALTAPTMRKFARAWNIVREQGERVPVSKDLTESLKGLAEFTMLHLD
jgi:hypothetical protein